MAASLSAPALSAAPAVMPASLSAGRGMADFPAAARMLIEKDELLSLLPHKGKMLLLNRITEYDVNRGFLCSEYDMSGDCLFYDPALGGAPAWMSFEFMAQSVSALSGLTGRIMGKPPMLGFILSVSSFEIKTPVLRPGETVRTSISEVTRVGMVSTFRCTVFQGEAEVSSCQLMLMDVEDPYVYIGKDSYGK